MNREGETPKVSLGFVVGLDYADARLSVHDVLQEFKLHPLVRKILKDGKRIHVDKQLESPEIVLARPDEGIIYHFPSDFGFTLLNPPVGARFDPHQHQAISVVHADQEPNTVVTLLQKGYAIADRVLRPALVTVSASA